MSDLQPRRGGETEAIAGGDVQIADAAGAHCIAGVPQPLRCAESQWLQHCLHLEGGTNLRGAADQCPRARESTLALRTLSSRERRRALRGRREQTLPHLRQECRDLDV
eukprot:11495626-Alexandrium_andersonii.AAC.1